jgi:hypothetical protein
VKNRKQVRKNKMNKVIVGSLLLAGAAGSVYAQTDATSIVTAVTAAFALVAAACVSIGTFFVVYRLVKRIK